MISCPFPFANLLIFQRFQQLNFVIQRNFGNSVKLPQPEFDGGKGLILLFSG